MSKVVYMYFTVVELLLCVADPLCFLLASCESIPSISHEVGEVIQGMHTHGACQVSGARVGAARRLTPRRPACDVFWLYFFFSDRTYVHTGNTGRPMWSRTKQAKNITRFRSEPNTIRHTTHHLHVWIVL